MINITVNIPLRTLNRINLEVSNIFTIKDNNPPRLTDKLLDRINRREGKGISYEFIIDSGALVYTVYNKDLFLSTKSTNRRVAWGKVETRTVNTIGQVLVQDINTHQKVLLKDVFYLPQLGINIISVKQLKCVIILDEDNVQVFEKPSHKLLLQGCDKRDLYYLPLKVVFPTSKVFTLWNSYKSNPLVEWHIKLGHIGLDTVQRFLKGQGIIYTKENLLEVQQNSCEICLQAQPNRTINKTSKNPVSKDSKVLDRIHSDIGGPLVPTYDKYKYYITFIDKASRFVEVVLLRSKSDALDAFNSYKLRAERLHNTTIKELFTDNGTEYINSYFEAYLNKYGILHSRTPVYTKEPNGLAERINRTLLNKVRSILFYSELPPYL